jgi:site-specific DNA-adenine methylase
MRAYHWICFTGHKFNYTKRLEPILDELPDHITTIVDLFCGCGGLSLSAMEYFRSRNQIMNFILYDINPDLVKLLNMLTNNKLEVLLDDPMFQRFNNILRYNITGKSGVSRPRRTEEQNEVERQRKHQILINCYKLMKFHNVKIICKSCMDVSYKNHDLILFDPPYFGGMVKYTGETLTVKDYATLLDRITKNNFFIFFNDELSQHLKWFVDCYKIKYIIKRGGYCKSRTELMITNVLDEDDQFI